MNNCETREVSRTRNTDVGEGMVLVLSVSSLRVWGGDPCVSGMSTWWECLELSRGPGWRGRLGAIATERAGGQEGA